MYSAHMVAIGNGYEENLLEIHQFYVNFEEIDGTNYYSTEDRGEKVWFNNGYDQYGNVNTDKDKLNYAFTIESFRNGLVEIKIR